MDMLQDFSTLQFPNTEPYGAVSDPSSFNLDSQMDLAPLPTMEIEGFTTQAITMTNPFVTSESTHLPTPQSPGNMANYVVDTNPSPTAPHSLPALHRTTHGASTQMVTPDSSPMVSRWSLPSSTATQTRQRSPQTPSPTQPPSLPATDIVVEPRTPPPGATALLSSPFSPPSHTQQLAGGASYSPAYSPTHAGSASPSLPNAPSGGVLEGIRAARAAMQQETEARRPDYLQRSSYGAANASSGASIAESPMKGRRIELFGFTETSEESFEERLMAGGYIGYGATGGATEPPSTPGRYINDFLGSTPVTTNKRPIEDVIEADVDDATLDEKERRKRKRLQPFMSGQKKSKCMLFPVELEQHGRVLIDLHIPTKEEPREQPETPKRKGGRRRKPRPRGARAPPGAAPNGEPGLHWPDSVFPWSVRTDERKLIERAEEQRKLKAIAHYLDSDTSDSEDSEDKELQPRPPPFLDLGRPKPMPSRGGLGKSIPQAEAVRHNIFVPSDSADARAALLCQRHVRALIALQRAENMALCICGEGDNDRAQVQCDRCYRWYHLRCINIPSIDDLGPYDAQWFCYACEDNGRGPQTASTHAEPTLVRDDALPYPSYPRDPLFYDAGSYDPASPTPSTSRPPMTPRPDPPTPRTPTPAHTSTVRVYETPNTSFSADGIEPFDPSSTPSRGIRQKEGSGTWERARYGGMFTPHAPPPNHGSFSTPANRVGTLLATPLAARASMSLPRFSATFSGQYIPGGVAVDETPIDHSTAKGVGSRSLRGVADSPLMGRDSRRVAVGASGSPSLRAT